MEVPQAHTMTPVRMTTEHDVSLESTAGGTPRRDPFKGKGPCVGETSDPEDTPFSRNILEDERSHHFQMSQLRDYARTIDHKDHIGQFENATLLIGIQTTSSTVFS